MGKPRLSSFLCVTYLTVNGYQKDNLPQGLLTQQSKWVNPSHSTKVGKYRFPTHIYAPKYYHLFLEGSEGNMRFLSGLVSVALQLS